MRAPRTMFVPYDATVHVTWRCHNKSWFLHTDDMKRLYYDLLLKYKEKYEIKIYSYSLMSSHPHMTIFCKTPLHLAKFFQVVNNCFARRYNKENHMTGQVVQERYKSQVIESDEEHAAVVIYGDLNQVRARMINHPKHWKWSSFRHYAYGVKDELIDDAPFYCGLGITEGERRRRYTAMLEHTLKTKGYEKRNYSKGYYIGNPIWVEQKMSSLKAELKERMRRRIDSEPSDEASGLSPP